MEVLNHKQRNRAYWLFVLFFVITVAVLVSAIFFNAYFPFKENSLLKKENIKMQKEMEIQDNFSFQVEIPDKYQAKDFSDLVLKYGREKAKKILEENLTPF